MIRSPDAASALGTRAIANPTTPGGIGIGRGEHPQQGRTAAGAGGLATTTHPSDSACPLESSMHRCVFLGLRFIHRQKLPTSRNATRNSRSTLHHSVGPGGTRIPPGIAFLASVTPHPAAASLGPGANVSLSRSRSRPELSISRERTPWRCDHGDCSQRLPRVPISSDQGHVFVDRDHHEPGLLKNEI